MKISIAGTLALLTLTSAVSVPAHAAAPAAVAPRTSQTPKPTPSPKPAAGQFSAGQDTRIDSQRSRQPVKPQSPESNGIYSNNIGGGLLGVNQDGGIDGEFRASGANRKSSDLDQSTPILNNKQPTPPATSVGK